MKAVGHKDIESLKPKAMLWNLHFITWQWQITETSKKKKLMNIGNS